MPLIIRKNIYVRPAGPNIRIARVEWVVSNFILLLIAGPIVTATLLSVLSSHQAFSVIFLETFTPDRLMTLLRIAERSAGVALAGLAFGSIIGIWLGRNQGRQAVSAILIGLIAPFFVNDAIKAYAWADILDRLSEVIQRNGGAPVLVDLFSPYGGLAPALPLTLSAIPICASLVAMAYSGDINAHELFAREVAARHARRFALVTFPLLAPYLICAWLLAFGFVFGASAEEQYLGGPLSNNVRTLMQSLLRTGVAHTQLFSLSLLCFVGLISYVAINAVFSPKLNAFQRAVYKIMTLIGGPSSLASTREQASHSAFSKGSAGGYDKYLSFSFRIYLAAIMCLSWAPLLYAVRLGLTDCDDSSCHVGLTTILAAFASPRYVESVEISTVLGLSSAFFSFAFALLGMWVSITERITVRLVVICVLCIIMPGDPTAIGLQQLAKLLGAVEGSMFVVLIGQLTLVFPYAVLLGIVAGYAQPKAAIMSLFEFGSSLLEISRTTVIKQSYGGLTAAGILGFLLSMNDYVRPFYLGGASETISAVIYGRLNAGGITGERSVFGFSALIVLVGIIGVAVAVQYGAKHKFIARLKRAHEPLIYPSVRAASSQ